MVFSVLCVCVFATVGFLLPPTQKYIIVVACAHDPTITIALGQDSSLTIFFTVYVYYYIYIMLETHIHTFNNILDLE